VLLLNVEPVYAEWEQVAGDDHLGTASYVDSGTIHREGNTVKMWVLNDYKTVQNVTGDPFLSTMQQVEHDCTEERARTLAFTIFSGNMGKGEVVFTTSEEGKWEPIPSYNNLDKILWEVACGKK